MTRRGSWLSLLPIMLISALLGCGGGDPSGPVTGSLAVAVSGLPAGAEAAVSVSGPGGFARTLTVSQTFGNLAPGAYSLAASGVSFGGSTYQPAPPAQSVTVTEGDTPTTAAVVYQEQVGLTITISGLPDGAAADVQVTGPGGFSQSVAASQTLSGLTQGTYTIAANSVLLGCSDYTPTPASQTATLTAGATAATVTYSGSDAGGMNLCINGMYLTQSVQTYAGAVPLVRGRDGYLRVFVTANQTNVAAPAVRVTFYEAGVATHTVTIDSPGLTTPLLPNEGNLSSSWNLPVPKAWIQPNLSIKAEVDPGNAIVESDEGDNSFPASGTPLPLDVRTLGIFNVRFVPVQVAGRIGVVTSGNKDEFLTEAVRMHPLAGYNADVREQLNSTAPSLSATTAEAWTQVLAEVDAARVSDGSSRYYFGVVNPNYTSGIAGVGYVGGQSALGWDKLPSASAVAAHEWGHNWGREHAPCGGASNPDVNYPYPGGATGAFGLDVATATLKPPTNSDLMGYCNPEWISDYTYKAVLSYRGTHADISTALAQAMQPCLLVWGRIENGQPVLEPAFEIVTRPSLPAAGGEYSVEGRGPDGSRIFSLPFTPREVADAPGDNRQFAFAIPMPADRASRLASLRLAGRGREAVSRSTAAIPRIGTAAPVSVRRSTDGGVALDWDVAAHPMLLVRDGATGQIMSFARGGRIHLPAGHSQLSVSFSNRVQSSEMRVAVPAR